MVSCGDIIFLPLNNSRIVCSFQKLTEMLDERIQGRIESANVGHPPYNALYLFASYGRFYRLKRFSVD